MRGPLWRAARPADGEPTRDIHATKDRPSSAPCPSLDDFFAAATTSFTLSLWPARTLEPTDNRLTGGSMDLVAAAVVLALAALSFVWLAFVERA